MSKEVGKEVVQELGQEVEKEVGRLVGPGLQSGEADVPQVRSMATKVRCHGTRGRTDGRKYNPF